MPYKAVVMRKTVVQKRCAFADAPLFVTRLHEVVEFHRGHVCGSAVAHDCSLVFFVVKITKVQHFYLKSGMDGLNAAKAYANKDSSNFDELWSLMTKVPRDKSKPYERS